MSLLSRLFLLFVGVPLLELFLLIQMGEWIGFLPTIAVVVATGVGGAALARMEGLRTLWTIQEELAHGRLPGAALLDGAAVLFGGALLLTPGIITDLVGLSCLFPPTRRILLKRIRKALESRLEAGTIRVLRVGGRFGSGPVGTWEEQDDASENLDPSREIVVDADGSRHD
jgi:UPF0716 protein FxsA